MSFTTKCCTRLCRMKRSHETAAEFTPKNSIVASVNFPVTGARAAGKKRICRDFCADNPLYWNCNHQTDRWLISYNLVKAMVGTRRSHGRALTALPLSGGR